MKRKYDDLSVDEKKEFYFLNKVVGLGFLLTLVVLSILFYPMSFSNSGTYLFKWHFGMMVFAVVICYVLEFFVLCAIQ